jgi:lambda family phage portal protein
MATTTKPPSKPNLIDRLVGYINPAAGLRRTVARDQLARAYEGASRRDGWAPRRPGASANTDHFGDATELRTRARALVQNVPYIEAGISALVAATIGTGISPRSLAPKPEAEKIDRLWDQWAQVADADGLGDFASLQERAYRAMEVDGEVLVRLRPRFSDDGLPVPLQLQLLEIDWLDSAKSGTVNGNSIINGIEYDALGRVSQYWLFDQHPGEMLGKLKRNASRPVPAARIIHLYRPTRPGQGRGFSRLAPVVSRVRDLQLYEDSEISRKNLESRLGVIASGDITKLADGPSLDGGGTQATDSTDLGQLASGGITGIPPGMNLTVIEPKAAPGYVEYVAQQHHIIAAGIGVPYESMTGDMSQVNFSSARIRRIDFKRAVEQTQWLLLIPQFCNRVRRAWLDAAVLAGKIQRPEPGVDWSTPKWEYVNPSQDVKADSDEIAAGLSSFSEKLRQRGYKPDLVFSELKADLDRLQKDGVLPLLFAMRSGNAQAAADSKAQGETG